MVGLKSEENEQTQIIITNKQTEKMDKENDLLLCFIYL